MPTSRMLRHKVSISRHSAGDGMVRSQSQVASDVAALVMPMDQDSTTQYGIAIGQAYKIYVNADQVIKVTDKITDNRGRVFTVRGVREYEDFDRMSHNVAYSEMIGRSETASESE